MSYILDALRRADAERERGAVPGLYTQAMPETADDAPPARRRGRAPWQWLAIWLTGGLAVAVAWTWRGDEPSPPAPAPLPVQPAPTPAAVAPAPPAVTPVTAPAESPAAPAPAAPVAIAPMRASPAPAATPLPAPAAAPATSPAPPAALPRVNSLAELPPDVRAGLPPLAFGGSIYSSTPASRLLIVNGQLMHEGDALAPGVMLEQIKPKAAVLNIRGQRYEVGL